MTGLDYKVGDMVIDPVTDSAAVVLGFEDNMLFDSVYCVKVMYVGDSKRNLSAASDALDMSSLRKISFGC